MDAVGVTRVPAGRRGAAARAPPRRALADRGSSRSSSVPSSSRSRSRSRDERGRAPLRERSVALVHVDRDPAEQQRLGERRRLVGLDRDQPVVRARRSPITSRSAGTSKRSRTHSRVVSSSIGNSGTGPPAQEIGAPLPLLPERRAASREATREQQRSRRDLSEDGGEHRRCPAATRRRPPRSASGSNTRSSIGIRSTASGSRRTIPSSDHSTCAPDPRRSCIRASIASAQGACTREPNGDRMHTRQSPSSSRKRSTTIVRSSGTAPRWPRPVRRCSRRGSARRARRARCPRGAGASRRRAAWSAARA